jgi:hypothetical protein
MENNSEYISVEAAKLIIGYTHNSLTEEEKDQLDEWITASDDNLAIFETLAEKFYNNVLDPDSLIIETENLLDVWMIAGLIARDMQNVIEPDEKKRLEEWIEESENNRAIYKSLTNPANLHKFVLWFKQWLQQSISPTGLN